MRVLRSLPRRFSQPAVVACFALLGLSAACGSAGVVPGASRTAADAASEEAIALPADASFTDSSVLPESSDVDAVSPIDATSEATTAAPPTALLHFIGRFDTSDPKGPRFAWPGSAIAATFVGTGIDMMLQDQGTNFFGVVVDGGASSALSTSNAKSTYALASGLGSGSHTIVVTKKTESYAGVVQFIGFTTHGGSIIPSPEPFSRTIEYVGDSITCGYGDLGVGPSCVESSAVEDETVGYAALTAAKLNASQTVIAYSGIGVVRNYDGSTAETMPVRFDRTLADDPNSVWPFTAPAPDVVVVNLGTNDFHSGDGGNPDPGTPFQAAYAAFVTHLRAHYPKAQIVCTLSPMLIEPSRSQARTYIQAVVGQSKAAGDGAVSFFEFAAQDPTDGYGCDYHPSKKTHEMMATALAPAISALTGW